jgi:hypothetical protein
VQGFKEEFVTFESGQSGNFFGGFPNAREDRKELLGESEMIRRFRG